MLIHFLQILNIKNVDKMDEDKLKMIEVYKKKIRNRQFCGTCLNVVILILCICGLSILTIAVVGWCHSLKVEDILSQTVLISWMIILIVVATLVVNKMLVSRNQYRMAMLRLDSLILRLKFNENGDKEIGWVERELLLITRILESNAAECKVEK